MALDLETIDALGLIYDKVKVTIDCIIEDSQCPRGVQTLAYIAKDYLCELSEQIQSM